MRGVFFEDVAHGSHQGTVKPDFDHLAITRQQFGELAAIESVISRLHLGSLAPPARARTELIIAGRKIDAQLQPALAAGLGKIGHDIAFAVSPGRVADAISRGFGLPHAESTHMLGDEDNVLCPQAQGAFRPLVGVQLARD